ncbi:MAG: ATP-dependent DNA helicase RecG [Chitinophagales bacterium]|nr:ATP-dependent DNA helicase RecG [Chitinophagales bacterium]
MSVRLKLSSTIESIAGLAAARCELLKKNFQIFTVYDLLHHFPFRYIDKSKVYQIAEVDESLQYIQLYGTISNFQMIGEGPKRRLTAKLRDKSGDIELVWFQGVQYYQKGISSTDSYLVFGKPQKFGSKYTIAHPELRKALPEDIEKLSGFQPLYPSSEAMKKKGLDSAGIFKIIKQAYTDLDENEIFEFLPKEILSNHQLISYPEAIYQIHFPKSNQQILNATKRIKFDEFFQVQIHLKKLMAHRVQVQHGYVFPSVENYFDRFYHQHLPFPLTHAQKRVLKEIRRDTMQGRQMNRLLQGDVGSGKTIVAFMTMLMAVDNGFQASIMAPTEILARQHYEHISELANKLGVKTEILTGTTKAKDKKRILDELEHGKIDILIGTHALIEPTVIFKNLGIVVIDEQHRFGVAQRAALWKKNDLPPHVLVMTATPIPRTLAMTLYGDLDYSVIDELPPGRKPISTKHFFYTHRQQCHEFIKSEIAKGRQVYIVYPLIEESAKIDLKNLLDGYEDLKKIYPESQYSMTMVHGKMKNEEKTANMELFVTSKVQILVSTTVIEVGVNVPNASVMLIENADRFGLSQLHQLRGRVGRGAGQSYCLLMTEFQLSLDARKRMQVMVESTDGFFIAEEDLKLRGPGDIDGTRQSGDIQLKLASISKDADLLQLANQVAQNIIDEDAELTSEKYKALRHYIHKTNKEVKQWGKVS